MKSRPALIMQLLAEGFVPPASTDWVGLYPSLRSNALTPWVFKKYGDGFNEESRRLYEGDFVFNSLLNEALLSEAARLESRFGEDLTRIKGSALSALIYGGQSTRVFYDVDFLVEKSQAEKIARHLLANDYKRSAIVEWAGTRNRNNFSKVIGHQVEINFDLHTELFWESREEAGWRTEFDSSFGFRRLRHEDHFFYLIVNWAFQDTFIGLNKFLDIFLMWKNFSAGFDHERLLYLIKLHRLDRVFQIVFALLEKFFGVNALPFMQNLAAAHGWLLGMPDAEFLLFPRAQTIKYFTLKHFSKSNLAQALRYDLGWSLARVKGRVCAP